MVILSRSFSLLRVVAEAQKQSSIDQARSQTNFLHASFPITIDILI